MNFITESLSSRDIAMGKLKFEVFEKFKFFADSKNLKNAESSRLLISEKIFVESRKRYFVNNLKSDRKFKVLWALKAALIFIFVCAHHRWFEVKSFKERLKAAWSWKYVPSILLTLNSKHKKCHSIIIQESLKGELWNIISKNNSKYQQLTELCQSKNLHYFFSEELGAPLKARQLEFLNFL